jgi:predicted amidohydrolase
MRTLLYGGTIVNEGKTFDGTLIIEDGKIGQIIPGNHIPEASFDETIDASGCFVLPGIIDDHVHFREPGLTEKAELCPPDHYLGGIGRKVPVGSKEESCELQFLFRCYHHEYASVSVA